ncbi:MAG: hypothetical protein JEZ04_10285 [Spirochaetales bacterium]|nr:hypothetical protein [Spirochaetales bacterium]
MKRTGVLKILHDTTFPVNKLVIHPNTGFDLGFVQLKYVTKIFINTRIEDFSSGCAEPFCDAEVLLLNECGNDTVEMGQKLWDKIGRPSKTILMLDEKDNRLFLASK